MFLGQFAAGLLAHRAEPRLRLGTAFLGSPHAVSMVVVVPLLWWWGNRLAESNV